MLVSLLSLSHLCYVTHLFGPHLLKSIFLWRSAPQVVFEATFRRSEGGPRALGLPPMLLDSRASLPVPEEQHEVRACPMNHVPHHAFLLFVLLSCCLGSVRRHKNAKKKKKQIKFKNNNSDPALALAV